MRPQPCPPPLLPVILVYAWSSGALGSELQETDVQRNHPLILHSISSADDDTLTLTSINSPDDVPRTLTSINRADDDLLAIPSINGTDEDPDSLDNESAFSLTYETHRHQLEEETAEDLEQPGFTIEIESRGGLAFARNLAAFVDFSLTGEQFKYAGQRQTERDQYATLNQLWLQWTVPESPGLSIRAGRQKVSDGSGWWWDEEVNAIALSGFTAKTEFQLAIAQGADELRSSALPDDPELDGLIWSMGSLHYQLNDRSRFGLYLVSQADHSSSKIPGQTFQLDRVDERDDDLRWLGLQWHQAFTVGRAHRFLVQLEGALMSGTLDRITVEDDGDDEGAQSETEEAFDEESDDEEDSADPAALAEDAAATVSQRMVGSVNAWALRSAIKWTPSLNSDISFSLGYAVGSGTRANARAGSETFLQPGLYSNELDDHYYGEVLEPELSNLQIVSLRLSGTVFESTQFRLTHQRYFRDTKEDETLETELDLELSGEGRSLGHETSLAFDIELTEDLSSEVTLARFTPGSAIDSETRKPITFLALELAYEF